MHYLRVKWEVDRFGRADCRVCYWARWNSAWSLAVESSPTQTSKCSGSTTHCFVRRAPELQFVFGRAVNWRVCLAPGLSATRLKPLSWRTGREALPARW